MVCIIEHQLLIFFLVVIMPGIFFLVERRLDFIQKKKWKAEWDSWRLWREMLAGAKDFHVDKGFWVINPEGDDHLAQAYKKIKSETNIRFNEILAALEHPDQLVRTNAFNLLHDNKFEATVVLNMSESIRQNISFPNMCSLCQGIVDVKKKYRDTIQTEQIPKAPLCIKHMVIPIKRINFLQNRESNLWLLSGGIIFCGLIYLSLIHIFPFLLLWLGASQPLLNKLSFLGIFLFFLFSGVFIGWHWEKKWGTFNPPGNKKLQMNYYLQPHPVSFSMISTEECEFRFKNPAYAKLFIEINQGRLVKTVSP